MAYTNPSDVAFQDPATSAHQQIVVDDIRETAPAKVAATGDLVVGAAPNSISRLQLSTAPALLSGDGSAVSWLDTIQTYTPSWGASVSAPSVGNGTISGRWCELGPLVWFQIQLEIGTTTNVGNGAYDFGLPVAIGPATPALRCTFSALIVDASAGNPGLYPATAFGQSGSTKVDRVYYQGGIYGSASPAVPADGDYLAITGLYSQA